MDSEFYIDKLKSKLSKCDFYRIFAEQSHTEILDAKDGEIDTVKKENSTGISCFYTLNKLAYFYSTNDLEQINKFEIANKTTKIKNLDYEPKESGIKDKKTMGKKSKLDLSELTKDIAAASKLSEKIVSNFIHYSSETQTRRVVCENTDITQTTNYGFALMMVVAKDGNKIRTDGKRFGKTNNLDRNIFQFLTKNEELKKSTIKKLNYKESLKGKFDIILDPELSDLLAHEAFGHATESDSVYKNQSVLKTKIGAKIAPSFVTLLDDPTPKDELFGSFYYDDEGFPAKTRELIKHGRIKDLIMNDKYSQLMKVKNNGGARCEGYDKMPIPRMSNTSFEHGEYKINEIIKEMKNGLLLIQGNGGQTNPATGVYQFGVREGQLIKNGEITEKFVNITYGGNILNAIKNISQISKETGRDFVGFCGKDNQSIPVGGIGPYIKIKNARVG